MRHLPVRGAMNCATTSQFFVNDRHLFRNGIRCKVRAAFGLIKFSVYQIFQVLEFHHIVKPLIVVWIRSQPQSGQDREVGVAFVFCAALGFSEVTGGGIML